AAACASPARRRTSSSGSSACGAVTQQARIQKWTARAPRASLSLEHLHREGVRCHLHSPARDEPCAPSWFSMTTGCSGGSWWTRCRSASSRARSWTFDGGRPLALNEQPDLLLV